MARFLLLRSQWEPGEQGAGRGRGSDWRGKAPIVWRSATRACCLLLSLVMAACSTSLPDVAERCKTRAERGIYDTLSPLCPQDPGDSRFTHPRPPPPKDFSPTRINATGSMMATRDRDRGQASPFAGVLLSTRRVSIRGRGPAAKRRRRYVGTLRADYGPGGNTLEKDAAELREAGATKFDPEERISVNRWQGLGFFSPDARRRPGPELHRAGQSAGHGHLSIRSALAEARCCRLCAIFSPRTA